MDYKRGWGKFKSGTEVEVELSDGGSETLSAKNIIIATGSEVSPLKGIEVDEERWASPSTADRRYMCHDWSPTASHLHHPWCLWTISFCMNQASFGRILGKKGIYGNIAASPSQSAW